MIWTRRDAPPSGMQRARKEQARQVSASARNHRPTLVTERGVITFLRGQRTMSRLALQWKRRVGKPLALAWRLEGLGGITAVMCSSASAALTGVVAALPMPHRKVPR